MASVGDPLLQLAVAGHMQSSQLIKKKERVSTDLNRLILLTLSEVMTWLAEKKNEKKNTQPEVLKQRL